MQLTPLLLSNRSIGWPRPTHPGIDLILNAEVIGRAHEYVRLRHKARSREPAAPARAGRRTQSPRVLQLNSAIYRTMSGDSLRPASLASASGSGKLHVLIP